MLTVKTKLGISPIHGIGLFAGQFIAEGEIVWKFNPLIDIRFPSEEMDQLADEAREQIRKYSYREEATRLYVLCGDDARFFNHSSTPNCIDIIHGTAEDVTRTLRDIYPGEELTCNYMMFDLDLIEGRYQIETSRAAGV